MRGKMFRRVGRPDPVQSFTAEWVSSVPQLPQIRIKQIVLPDNDYGALASVYIEFTRPDGKVFVPSPTSLPFSETAITLEQFSSISPALDTAAGVWGVRVAAATSGGPIGLWSEQSQVTVGA